MDDALAEWLALREHADAAARSERLTQAIVDASRAHDPVHILDLATGTGSNIRYLMPRIPGRQRWLAVDRSPTLLAQLRRRMTAWAAARGCDVTTDEDRCVIRGAGIDCQIQTRALDLGVLGDPALIAGRHLVTASALLDLVSAEWLRSLASACRAAGAASLFTITYDGRSSCVPKEPEDDLVLDLFNRHQRTDKGLGGSAAGPGAVERAVSAFTEAGYRVEHEPSDWALEPGDGQLQRQLIDGWAEAATEIEPAAASMIEAWRLRRLHHVDAGRSQIVVGHEDVAALAD